MSGPLLSSSKRACSVIRSTVIWVGHIPRHFCSWPPFWRCCPIRDRIRLVGLRYVPGLPRCDPRHRRRSRRLFSCRRISRDRCQRHRRSERFPLGRSDRRHAGIDGAQPNLRRGTARIAHLQATSWNFISNRAAGERPLACVRQRRRRCCADGGGIIDGFRHEKLASVLFRYRLYPLYQRHGQLGQVAVGIRRHSYARWR